MQDKAAAEPEYRSYTTPSFARWARFYDLFVALFGVRGVRRPAVEIGEDDLVDRHIGRRSALAREANSLTYTS